VVDQLAGILAAEDARRFDGALFSEAANDPEPLVRSHAALAMGRIGDAAALPLLLDLLNDENGTVQEDAEFALGLLRSPDAVTPLRDRVVRSLAGTDAASATEAVTAIAVIGGAEGAAAFGEIAAQALQSIQSGEPRPAAVRAMVEAWRLGSNAPVDALLRAWEVGGPEVKRSAIYSLARLSAPGAGAALINAAGDSDADVRGWVARTLTATFADSSGLGRQAVAPIVNRLAEDDAPGVRINALRSLSTYEDAGLAGPALDLASDPDINVRVEALAALGQLRPAQAGEILATQVKDRVPAVGHQALLSLARVNPDAALREAAVWITSADWRRRMLGVSALGIIGGDTALGWLELLLDDRDGRVVGRAFSELARRDSLWALELAPEIATHADPVARTAAVSRLASPVRPAHLSVLITAYEIGLRDPIPDARIAVVEALGAIAAMGSMQEFAVQDQFVERFPTCDDYLVRQAAEEHLPIAAARWGPAFPVETGRAIGDYREIARRMLVPGAPEGAPGIVIETDRGDIVVSLFAGDAPITVNAMLQLVDRRSFDGGAWHRVVPNFVIQDGDPRGDGWGGPGYALRDEINRRRYVAGTVGMALSGPDTGGSQFFITLGPQPHLDGTYTVFGQVESGMDLVQRITAYDAIRTIRRQ